MAIMHGHLISGWFFIRPLPRFQTGEIEQLLSGGVGRWGWFGCFRFRFGNRQPLRLDLHIDFVADMEAGVIQPMTGQSDVRDRMEMQVVSS